MNKSNRVREVHPEREAAIEKMVEALERIRAATAIEIQADLVYIANAALEAWRKANE